MCNHKWKMYNGFSESFEYCELCDVKKSEDSVIMTGTELAKKQDDFFKVNKEFVDLAVKNFTGIIYGKYPVESIQPLQQNIQKIYDECKIVECTINNPYYDVDYFDSSICDIDNSYGKSYTYVHLNNDWKRELYNSLLDYNEENNIGDLTVQELINRLEKENEKK